MNIVSSLAEYKPSEWYSHVTTQRAFALELDSLTIILVTGGTHAAGYCSKLHEINIH